MKRAQLSWNQKVRRWALRYLADLTDQELADFNKRLTLQRNLTPNGFRALRSRRNLPSYSGRTIQLYSPLSQFSEHNNRESR